VRRDRIDAIERWLRRAGKLTVKKKATLDAARLGYIEHEMALLSQEFAAESKGEP
jgi:hypothetical protein